MPSKGNYDVESMAARFIQQGRTAEQINLVKEFRQAVTHCGTDFKHFLAEVAHEAYAQGLQPVNTIALGIMYGMVMGVLMEQERAQKRRLV